MENRPFASDHFVEDAVGLVLGGDGGHEWIVGIGVGEEAEDAEENFTDGESGTPLILENVEADSSLGTDVGMVDLCQKGDVGLLEGVIRGESDREFEDAAGEGTLGRPEDDALPVIQILFDRAGTASSGRILRNILEFLLNATKRHGCVWCRVLQVNAGSIFEREFLPKKNVFLVLCFCGLFMFLALWFL